jgi:hypothetical protein
MASMEVARRCLNEGLEGRIDGSRGSEARIRPSGRRIGGP